MKLKSKFTQIVDIKKQNLSKIEANLAKKRSEVVVMQNFIKQTDSQIASHVLPSSGNFIEIRASLELLKAIRNQKAQLTERLGLIKTEIIHLENQYKNANLEFEKMKYLQTEDFNIQLMKIKRNEALALDEFATMKFARMKEIV
ncbi:MAG: flagellar FliJ family protein [Campylobacter sp.]